LSGATASATNGTGLSTGLERALNFSAMDGSSGSYGGEAQGYNNGSGNGGVGNINDELNRLRTAQAEQEARWKQSYDTILRENEVLRSKGGESLLATQWRGRYEACMREKEELAEKLRSHTAWTNSVNASGKSVEQAYVELQEEFAVFRKKVAAIDRRRLRTTASTAVQLAGTTTAAANGAAGGSNGAEGAGLGMLLNRNGESDLGVLLREYEMLASQNATASGAAGSGAAGNNRNGGGNSSSAHGARGSYSGGSAAGMYGYGSGMYEDSSSGGGSGGGSGGASGGASGGSDGAGGMTASKIKYVRHMIFQYLCCKEPEVKTHMETALMAIFRMSNEEREAIEAKRREDTQDTLSTISSFLGSLGT
jgi:hypothetical protein